MEILEKVAYMKGLAEGLGLDGQTKEGKLLTVMMDILDDMALELQDMREGQIDLEEALDAVSDDLSDVESRVYEDEDEEEDEEDGEVYQTTCPNCGEEGVRGGNLLRRDHFGGRRRPLSRLRREAGVRPGRERGVPQLLRCLRKRW